MTKLTKREKRMLYTLGCFLIVTVGVYLFILPAISTQAALTRQVAELEAQQNARVEAISKMNLLDAQVKTLKAEMERTCARYAQPMYSEQLDRQFTSMLRRHNAAPASMIIGELTDTPMPHYRENINEPPPELTAAEVPPLADYMAAVDPSGTVAAAVVPTPNENEAVPEDPAEKEDATLQTMLITVEAIMEPSDAIAFMAELSADPAVVVQSVAMEELDGELTAEGVKIETGKVTMTVEFLHLIAPDLPYGDSTRLPNIAAFE